MKMSEDRKGGEEKDGGDDEGGYEGAVDGDGPPSVNGLGRVHVLTRPQSSASLDMWLPQQTTARTTVSELSTACQ